MINSDDPHSVHQLLCLLEAKLDKHADDIRCASSIAIKRDRTGS